MSLASVSDTFFSVWNVPCGSRAFITASTLGIILDSGLSFALYFLSSACTSAACTGSVRSFPAKGPLGFSIVAPGETPKLSNPHLLSAAALEGMVVAGAATTGFLATTGSSATVSAAS